MKKIFKLTLSAIVLSLLISFTCYIFGTVLIKMSDLATNLFPYNLMFLPLAGILMVFVRRQFSKHLDDITGKVFSSTKKFMRLSLVIVPYQMISTWLSHLVGASVGREGVALQLGATISNNYARATKMDVKLFTSAGKAAGFAGLFGTPLAALFFVFELNKKKVNDYSFWYLTTLMVFLSSFFTKKMGLVHFQNIIDIDIVLNIRVIIQLAIVTLCFIVVGNLFSYALRYQKVKFSKLFKNVYMKVFFLSAIYIILMLLCHGRYISLGTNLIDDAISNPQSILLVDFILKLFFTTFIVSIGFQGGEVTPLFAIGTTLGVVLSRIIALPVSLLIALGYSSVFANSTKAYLSGFFICIEIFGIKTLPYILITTIFSKIFKNKNSIYPII